MGWKPYLYMIVGKLERELGVYRNSIPKGGYGSCGTRATVERGFPRVGEEHALVIVPEISHSAVLLQGVC